MRTIAARVSSAVALALLSVPLLCISLTAPNAHASPPGVSAHAPGAVSLAAAPAPEVSAVAPELVPVAVYRPVGDVQASPLTRECTADRADVNRARSLSRSCHSSALRDAAISRYERLSRDVNRAPDERSAVREPVPDYVSHYLAALQLRATDNPYVRLLRLEAGGARRQPPRSAPLVS